MVKQFFYRHGCALDHFSRLNDTNKFRLDAVFVTAKEFVIVTAMHSIIFIVGWGDWRACPL